MEGKTDCQHCEAEINLGEINKPKTVEFIKLICSECGGEQKVSLLRMYQKAKIEKKLKKSES
jgi:protein-arginine kinase activator protein McsA